MTTPELTLACRYYDRTAALIAGAVPTPGITLRPVEMTDVAAMFAGLFRGEFDASEMSFGELVYYTSRGLNDFVAIPVFPYRMFRHGYIYRRTDADFTRPEEISGRRVALTRAVVTAGVWMRGMLTDDHSVSASETEWRYASVHHWETEGEDAGLTPRDGSTPGWLTTRADGVHESAVQALVNGEVDALCTTRIPKELTAASPTVARVFEDFPKAEADYFSSTGIFPIMHVVGVRKQAIEKHPELPETLFRAFAESKRHGHARRDADGSVSLAWKDHYLDRERELFGSDPWEYGLAKNRYVVEKFLSYCYQQGVSARELRAEELFAAGSDTLAE